MSKKIKTNRQMQEWIDARRRRHLSHSQVQMARELGMNPAKLGKIDNHKQEPWKAPLPQFIEQLYFKRFGRTAPVISAPLSDVPGFSIRRGEKALKSSAGAAMILVILAPVHGAVD